MTGKKTFAIAWTLLALAAFAYYAWLRIENAARVHEPRVFGDTQAYFENAALPLFSLEFWTHERPPMTALFWKLAGGDPQAIFRLQLYFSIAAWGVFAATAASCVKNAWLKLALYSLTLAFSLSRDIFMWDPFLGSESISLSFTALFLAASLRLMQGWDGRKAALMLACAFCVVLTRDVFAYFLLMTAGAALLVFFPAGYGRQAFAVALAFVLIYLFSAKIAAWGQRPYRALTMNLALRIYPSEEYTEYFRAHDVPIYDELAQMARNPQPGKKFAVYLALLNEPRYEAYRRWARASGSWEYVKFLWFYKADALQKVFLETPGPSFSPDVYYYTATGYRPILKSQRLAELLYPTRFGLAFFFAVNLAAAFVAGLAWRDGRALWFVPLTLILFSYPQAILVWAADANDIARHSISYNVLLRLGGWLLAFFVLDSISPGALKRIFFARNAQGGQVGAA